MPKRIKVQLHKERLCPIKRNCQAENIVCEAIITCNERNYGENIYIVIAKTTFKKRYSNHKRSFNLPAYKHDTELSKEFWKIKRRIYGEFWGNLHVLTIYHSDASSV